MTPGSFESVMPLRRLTIANTQIQSSALGFGCVKLTAHDNRRDALATLEKSLDVGITHFDVARLYGFGRAEGILGEFLRGKRDRVTVTTKLGLTPPAGLAGNKRLINLAKKVLGPFPGLLRRAKRRAGSAVQSSMFDPASAASSLETSLRELGTDYVDLLLLHEATISDAGREPLIRFLEDQ